MLQRLMRAAPVAHSRSELIEIFFERVGLLVYCLKGHRNIFQRSEHLHAQKYMYIHMFALCGSFYTYFTPAQACIVHRRDQSAHLWSRPATLDALATLAPLIGWLVGRSEQPTTGVGKNWRRREISLISAQRC